MTLNLLTKTSFVLLLLCLFGVTAAAQQTFFERASRLRMAGSVVTGIQKYAIYQLKEAELRTYLAKAPLEFQNNGNSLSLSIPLPDGTVEPFSMLDSPILSPAIAAQHPDIKTYAGTGQTHKIYTVRLSLTPAGFDAIILGVGSSAIYFSKVTGNPADQLYLTYFASDVKKPDTVTPFGPGGKCGSIGALQPFIDTNPTNAKARQALNNTGTQLRTYRLAVAATGEFTTNRGGGNQAAAFTALTEYVNRMNAVYRVELSVAFTLVTGVSLVYTNAATDPYTNTNQITMLTENQTSLDALVGPGNYDIGHVVSYEGGSGGGIAAASSLCNAGTKAQGVSGMGNLAQFPQVYDDQLLSHEVGHQFGMSHSFNSIIPVCTTREATTSVEPGAGATIMSYGFTCSDGTGDDNYEMPAYQPFLNFHTVSYKQAVDHMATVSGCPSTTPLTNAVPVISTFPAAVTIPKSTPFALTGAATDADGQTLSFQWEGTNIGTETPTAATLANTTKPPFFRSYPPVSTGTRYFPRLSAILDGSNYAKGDKLPSVGIATTHRLTVRDNVGGLTYNEVTVTVDGNSGPFLETTNLAGSYAGNTSQTITWNVANTTNAPINCANVDILLSTDGGQTFPTTLLANTPNDGTEAVTLPSVITSTARIKLQGSNTIFFDISNSNFSITAALPVELAYFRAEPAVNQVRLSWQTASERNSDRFTIERSQDLGEFMAIGSLAAAGESMQTRSYGLNDDQPLMGTSYYRLAQYDRDGRVQRSKPVAVTLDPSAPLLLVTPNPVTPGQIRYRLHNLTKPTMSLNTLLGTPVGIQSLTDEGAGQYQLRTATALPAGVYILRAESGAVQLTKRVVVID